MSISVLQKVAGLEGERGMATTPFNQGIQEEIERGTLVASAVRSGPLGLPTGEAFLTLTDKGRAVLQALPDAANTN